MGLLDHPEMPAAALSGRLEELGQPDEIVGNHAEGKGGLCPAEATDLELGHAADGFLDAFSRPHEVVSLGWTV